MEKGETDEKKLAAAFKKAVDYFDKPDPNLKLSQKELLKLYGYYKQGVMGDCTIPRPGMLRIRDRAKYDAWKACIGIPKLTAMRKYVEFARELIPALRMQVSL